MVLDGAGLPRRGPEHPNIDPFEADFISALWLS